MSIGASKEPLWLAEARGRLCVQPVGMLSYCAASIGAGGSVSIRDGRAPPSCPECRATMSLRRARKGPKAGAEYWVCSRRGEGCRKVLPANNGVSGSPTVPSHSPAWRDRTPVAWISARDALTEEYATIGAIPGCVHEWLAGDERIANALGQCVLIHDGSRVRQCAGESELPSALLLKLLQRGRTPLPTLDVEREALRHSGLLSEATDLALESKQELGWVLPPGSGRSRAALTEAVLGRGARRCAFALDAEFDFRGEGVESTSRQGLGSRAEARFLKQWVAEHLGPEAGHWFTLQAPLGDLLTSRGSPSSGDPRRVDFVFHHPGGEPFVVEVDGIQHADATELDRQRDDSLREVGIEVLRVATEEVERGHGATLDEVRRRCQQALGAFRDSDDPVAATILDCCVAAKVQFALAKAIGFGWLRGGRPWRVDLSGAGAVAATGICDATRLLAAFDDLYHTRSAPTACSVHIDDGRVISYARNQQGTWERVAEASQPPKEAQQLRIRVEDDAAPFHRMPHQAPDILIRPAFVPVALAATNAAPTEREQRLTVKASDVEGALPALRLLLRNLFRKQDYRDMQAEALFGVMQGRDRVVLLPTGAGKSLIYQLAGLLTPGMTLIVDPLVALMEDQIEGLGRCGIDRADFIASGRPYTSSSIEKNQVQFLFVAPERLQSPGFRETLESLARVSFINLVVIDEAHCVSEWGHDFRPAYLSLGKNLRTLCKGSAADPPPLLALTGTASRNVLRDMLADLDIDRRQSDSVVRPDTFDRPELTFEIVDGGERVDDPSAALRSVLNSLPSEFRSPPAKFYRAAGRNTSSGIVFVPHVNGSFGLQQVAAVVTKTTGQSAGLYAGKGPKGVDDWELRKRNNARAFKTDDGLATLVATKAFGMGIDKPNVRYTVHVGLPPSLEQLYQEAGRAGRDRESAKCKVIFFEYDRSRSDELLSQQVDLDTAWSRYRQLEEGGWRVKDDVMRSLYFHFGAFRGIKGDMGHVRSLLKHLGDLEERRKIEVPFGSAKADRERAIYRLQRVGVVDDYQVDHGAKRFIVDVRAFDYGRSRQAIVDYIRATQPARASHISSQLDKVGTSDAVESATQLAYMLIKFTYDLIERSRRDMIRASVDLARHAKEDAHVRRRLLDYLQDGIGAEAMDGLLGQERIDLEHWFEMVAKVSSPIEAGELRGLCIRRLESYPDHPCLRIARGVSEVLSSDCDDHSAVEQFTLALQFGIDRYDFSHVEVGEVADRLFDFAEDLDEAERWNSGLIPLATLAMYDFAHEAPKGARTALTSRVCDRLGDANDPVTARVVSTWRMRDLVDSLAEIVPRVVDDVRSGQDAMEANGGLDDRSQRG